MKGILQDLRVIEGSAFVAASRGGMALALEHVAPNAGEDDGCLRSPQRPQLRQPVGRSAGRSRLRGAVAQGLHHGLRGWLVAGTEADCDRQARIQPRRQTPASEPVVPTLPDQVPASELHCPFTQPPGARNTSRLGSEVLRDDRAVGERIDHVDGMTINQAAHMRATRPNQNTARMHFHQHVECAGGFSRRSVYGGQVIGMARALTFNGLASALAIDGRRHAAPSFAGDTICAWPQALSSDALPGRSDIGALRLRTVATKDRACADFTGHDPAGFDPAVAPDLNHSVLMPRRHQGLSSTPPPNPRP